MTQTDLTSYISSMSTSLSSSYYCTNWLSSFISERNKS